MHLIVKLIRINIFDFVKTLMRFIKFLCFFYVICLYLLFILGGRHV